jgi:hypothetical protein
VRCEIRWIGGFLISCPAACRPARFTKLVQGEASSPLLPEFPLAFSHLQLQLNRPSFSCTLSFHHNPADRIFFSSRLFSSSPRIHSLRPRLGCLRAVIEHSLNNNCPNLSFILLLSASLIFLDQPRLISLHSLLRAALLSLKRLLTLVKSISQSLHRC